MEYRIIRSRRKTLAIEITPRREVLVRAPLRMPAREIRRFVESRQAWIRSHLADLPAVTPLTPEEHHALIRAAKELLPGRVAFFASKAAVTYGRITVRSQQTRWGSCSSSGNLSFNCLLMPPEVQYYIIVHELCHRKEMNHSPRFWSEVEQLLPSYRTARQWLKAHGTMLLARFPATEETQK